MTHVLRDVDRLDGCVVWPKCTLSGELSLERARYCRGLFALPVLKLCLPSRETLLPSLPGHAVGAEAGADGEALASEPRLKNAADDLERSGLNDATADRFASTNTDIDDTLKGKREPVGSVLVVSLG